MASYCYTYFAHQLLAGNIDFDEAGDDIRVRLVMSSTTADTERDVTTWGGFTTDDECDDGSYSAQALANQATSADNANDRGEFDADNTTFTLDGDGTRNIAGAVIVKYVDGGNGDIPIAFVDFTADKTTTSLTLAWNAEGIIQATTT